MVKKVKPVIEKSIIEKINKFVERVKKEGIRIDKIILYGSYASTTPNKDSDIDVAIISKDFGKDTVEEGMFLFKVAGEIDSRIEPVPLSVKAYKENTWIPLIYEIRTKGIEIDL
ncbi:nucleotidyltransferase domain-containing protein [bacterium]|nr:nucleotidyltransferase domain-containing protein [bacterium]